MLDYFKDPSNRLKALEFAYTNVHVRAFICWTIEAFVLKELGVKIRLSGIYGDHPDDKYFLLHELIPELVHPNDLGMRIDSDFAAWGGSLHMYYNTPANSPDCYLEARLIHIQNAIELVKTKI